MRTTVDRRIRIRSEDVSPERLSNGGGRYEEAGHFKGLCCAAIAEATGVAAGALDIDEA
jgi:hypothetical protein